MEGMNRTGNKKIKRRKMKGKEDRETQNIWWEIKKRKNIRWRMNGKERNI